jgi:hypothetical protein
MSTRRRFTSALSLSSLFALFGGFTVSACAAFYVPGEDADNVQRCNTTEDCDDTGDNRYVPQCVYGEGQPENSSKICAADFDQVACGGENYDAMHPLSIAYADAVDAKAAYGQCEEENRGKAGCQPAEGGVCNAGLEINNDSGACYDPDDPIPALYPPSVGGIDIAGQDAKDQFCRWYFCDETFVCAKAGSRELCQPCSGTSLDDYGGGSCGELHIEGEPSSIYTGLGDANCDGNRPTTEAEFGPTPTP